MGRRRRVYVNVYLTHPSANEVGRRVQWNMGSARRDPSLERSQRTQIPDLRSEIWDGPLFVHCASSASIRIRAQCISMLGKHRWQCLRQKRLSLPQLMAPWIWIYTLVGSDPLFVVTLLCSLARLGSRLLSLNSRLVKPFNKAKLQRVGQISLNSSRNAACHRNLPQGHDCVTNSVVLFWPNNSKQWTLQIHTSSKHKPEKATATDRCGLPSTKKDEKDLRVANWFYGSHSVCPQRQHPVTPGLSPLIIDFVAGSIFKTLSCCPAWVHTFFFSFSYFEFWILGSQIFA